MKKLITIILSGFLVLNFSSVYAAKTSSTTASTTKPTPKAIKVATVNIYSPKITKINDVEYSISFDIQNREGIQSNIRYGVELRDVENSAIIDTNLSNESITLRERETKNLNINYKIPGFLPNGKYKLMIVAKNQNGLPLAYMPANLYDDTEIEIKESPLYLSISDCVLTIFNDASSTAKYKGGMGVDIIPSEKLIATCDVINKGVGNENNIKLELITHKRDNFGDILGNEILSDTFSIKGKSTQSISFTVPTMQDPQLYFVDMFFVNSNEQKISPSYNLLYSVHGPSAIIHNLIMDKTYYKKGDVANLKTFWTVTGGGMRIPSNKDTYVIKAEIKNALKIVCGETTKTTNNPSPAINNSLFQIAITQNCSPAIATVSIFDNKGNLLDASEINSQGSVSSVKINANTPSIVNIDMLFNRTYKSYAIVFVLVLALIGFGVVKLKKHEEENKN